MTKQEALRAIRSGENVTHITFNPGASISLDRNKIIDEKGYRLEPIDFWNSHTSEVFNDGWSICEKVKVLNN